MENLNLRFGKKPPKKDYRTFMFQNYLKDSVPTPPISLDILKRVYTNIDPDDPTVLFPIDKNDEIGDCTIAGMAHADTVWSALVGNKSIYPVDLVVRIYFHLTGGDDTGLAMFDVLEYFRKNVVAGEKILAYVSLNPHNHIHVKQAIMLFGGVFLGFQVQEKCLDEFRNKTPWKPGKLINAGHAVFATGYDTTGVNMLTWGNTQWGTWNWWDLCVDEAYVILPPEASNPEFAPGFDFDKLKSDLVEISKWSL
jgi:hypothetical protein